MSRKAETRARRRSGHRELGKRTGIARKRTLRRRRVPIEAGAEERSGMKEAAFRVWLKVEKGLSAGTVGSRISNCRRVERHEGDLDAHYDSDELDGLLQRLKPGEPEHGIPIAGDVYNGTATLKNAVSLYFDFQKGGSSRTGGRLMILRWPDGPAAAPWPRSERTVLRRRHARRSSPRR